MVAGEVAQDGATGRGKAERSDLVEPGHPSTLAQIESVRLAVEGGLDRYTLQGLLPAGCARNALDCALIDLEAKLSGRPAWELLGLAGPPASVVTVYTLSLDTPVAMANEARRQLHRPALKLKLGGCGDLERVAAVREVNPDAQILVDANTAWDVATLDRYMPELKRLGVALIEQPLPAKADASLAGLARTVPIAADESSRDRSSLVSLTGRFDIVNIKLDKAGGLTEAMELIRQATSLGMEIMVGCSFGTSLAIAPALIAAQFAKFVDLDAPLLLARDRELGLMYTNGRVGPAEPSLWG